MDNPTLAHMTMAFAIISLMVILAYGNGAITGMVAYQLLSGLVAFGALSRVFASIFK